MSCATKPGANDCIQGYNEKRPSINFVCRVPPIAFKVAMGNSLQSITLTASLSQQLHAAAHLCFCCMLHNICASVACCTTFVLLLHAAQHLCFRCIPQLICASVACCKTFVLLLHAAAHLCFYCMLQLICASVIPLACIAYHFLDINVV